MKIFNRNYLRIVCRLSAFFGIDFVHNQEGISIQIILSVEFVRSQCLGHRTLLYSLYKKSARVTGFRITFDRNEIETCGFDRWKQKTQAQQDVLKSDWFAMNQSFPFLMDMFCTLFLGPSGN